MEKRKSQVDKYNSGKRKKARVTIALLIVLLILAAASMLIGQYGVSPIETLKILMGAHPATDGEIHMISSIMMNIRLPRTIAAILIGGALAVAGITYPVSYTHLTLPTMAVV